MIYVASSWRNEQHGTVVRVLREAGLEVYDFKEPTTCFKWKEVLDVPEHEGNLMPNEYFRALAHPRALDGFKQDMDMLKKATTVVLVLPCGRSAHMELGYAIGRNKHTAILVDNPVKEMDLMHNMAQNRFHYLSSVITWAHRVETEPNLLAYYAGELH